MLLFCLALLMILAMRFGPDVPFKRMLNEYLVERPALWLAKQERHDFVYLIMVAVLLVGGGQMLLMFGPEFALIYAADLALYLDILAASYVTTALTNVKAVSRAVRERLAGWHIFRALTPFRSASRGRGLRRKSSPSRAVTDDDDRGHFALLTGGWSRSQLRNADKGRYRPEYGCACR